MVCTVKFCILAGEIQCTNIGLVKWKELDKQNNYAGKQTNVATQYAKSILDFVKISIVSRSGEVMVPILLPLDLTWNYAYRSGHHRLKWVLPSCIMVRVCKSSPVRNSLGCKAGKPLKIASGQVKVYPQLAVLHSQSAYRVIISAIWHIPFHAREHKQNTVWNGGMLFKVQCGHGSTLAVFRKRLDGQLSQVLLLWLFWELD